MDRLQTRTDPLGRTERFAYDLMGNLIRFTDRKGQVTTFTYEPRNLVSSAQYADGSTTSFTYDAVERLTSVADSVSGTILFEYDILDRQVKETTSLGLITYTYDAISRRTSMTVNSLSPVIYTYDAASRLIQVAQGDQSVTLGYDAASRRTTLTYPNGTVKTYSYDAAARVTSTTHARGASTLETVAYEYDAAGNRIRMVRGNGTATTLPGSAQATYDAANQQTRFNSSTSNLTYDANGNLIGQTDAIGTTIYTWDARNRLVAIRGPGLNADFIYDAFDRRVSKTINGVTTQYLYDGPDIIAELNGGAVAATYLRSLNIDEPFGRYGATTEFYHTDALGSTLVLTDSSGAVRTVYNYDPFGNTMVTGALTTNPFQFTGRENDGTGLYYYRARYYSPAMHRFLQEDPIDFKGGDINLYAYTFNNPINFTDPTGEIVPLVLLCIRGASTSIGFDVLAGRKVDLSGAAVGCLTGGLFKAGKVGQVLSAVGKAGKGKGHPRGEDRLVRTIEKEFNMTQKQKDLFKQAREDYKGNTSRRPSDNLSRGELREIAKDIKGIP